MASKTDLTAPVLSVDLAGIGQEIWPCPECQPWHVEILVDGDGAVFAREWHAAGCAGLAALLAGGA